MAWLKILLLNVSDVVLPADNMKSDLLVRSTGMQTHVHHGNTPYIDRLIDEYATDVKLFDTVPVWMVKIAKRIFERIHAQSKPEHKILTVVHVRRGDKLGHNSYAGLDEATSPPHIVHVVSQKMAPGASIYLMTNEWNSSLFEGIRDTFQLWTMNDFPELQQLVAGCPIHQQNRQPLQTNSRVSTHRVIAACDSLALYQIERYLAVLADFVVDTFASHWSATIGGDNYALLYDIEESLPHTPVFGRGKTTS
jgi:hypothetical protein